ncbi:MAG: hypothetical protein LBS53_04730, partial [Synergistaceae bacterium]|nr:hypothetical protein [Synergistaceae bacterium]
MSFAKRSPILFIASALIAALAVLMLSPAAPVRAASVPFGEIQQKMDEAPLDEKSVEEDTPKAPMSVEEFIELCKKGTPEEIMIAIENGADVNGKDIHGATVLQLAASRNPNPEVIALLIQHGADVNEADWTRLLWYAA